MATSSLGRLTLDLVAKVGNFIEPMSQAERHARRSGQGIADGLNIASLAAKGFGAVMAGVSVAGVTAFANEIITTGNEIKKFSQLSNTSVRDFQFYAKGAETAGISMESFADKMKDMQDRIGDYQQSGGGPLVDFFENIAPLVGVTIQQFQKLSGPQALQLYYDSLQKVGATQNDMKFYMEAIISDSSLLIPLLENGGEGFRKWGEAAERANAIMSDEMIENLALAKENVQMLSLQWDGLKATLVNNVVPVVQLVSDNMDDIKAVTLALTAAMAIKLVPTVVATSIQLVQLAAFSVRAGVGLIGLSASASASTGAMIAMRGALAFLGGSAGLAMLAAQGIAAGAAFLYMKKSSDEVKPSLDKQGKSIADLVIEYDNLTEAQQRAFKYQETVELKDLSESYTKAQQQVRAYASSIAEVVAKDEKTKTTVRGWIREFDQNAISAETLANRINKLSSIGEENKIVMDKHAVAATGAKNAMDAQQKVVTALDSAKKGLNQTTNRSITLLTEEQKVYQALTQKQREALNGIGQEVMRSQYIERNIKAGWSRDQAEYVANYREQAGLGYAKKLSTIELKQLETGFKIQEQNRIREESEKKIEEVKRRQLDLSQKQYSYSGSELKMLQKVAEINSKYGLNEIGLKYGIPKNLLAAIMAQESKGNINAKSPTGAIGPFQTTGIYRKQYGLSTQDSYDVKKSAEVAAQDIAKSFEVFGNWKDAITAYNAGREGTKQLNKKGFTGSAAKTKEAKAYAGMVDKWLVGLGGTSNKSSGFAANDVTANLKDWEEYWNDVEEVRKQSLERQKTIYQQYLNEEEQMYEANKEAIKSIELAYAKGTPEREKYLQLQQLAYKKDVEEFKRAQQAKYDSFKRDFADRIYNSQSNLDLMGVAAKYGRDSLTYKLKELGSYTNSNKRDNNTFLADSVGRIQDEYAAPNQEKERQDLIEQAYKAHKLRLQEIDAEHNEATKALVMQQASMQIQAFSGLTGSLMGLVDQSSSAYAALYSVQKSFNLAQAIMNGYTAISAAWASAPFPYNMGAVTMATIETGVLQSAIEAVTPVGMAHSGIDSVPREGTWLLDKGERVVTSNTSAKLDKTLDRVQQAQSSNPANSPNVNLNPNFVIVDEREKLGDYLYSPDGKKAFVKFFKQNKRELGFA